MITIPLFLQAKVLEFMSTKPLNFYVMELPRGTCMDFNGSFVTKDLTKRRQPESIWVH
jgi:hypothetical protein